MGLPEIKINFATLAKSFSKRSEKGTVGVIIKEKNIPTPIVLLSLADIKNNISEENKKIMQRIFLGNPKKVVVFPQGVDDTFEEALAYFTTIKVDYITIYPDATEEEITTASTFIKNARNNLGVLSKIVLPKCSGDFEGVINFTTDNIKTTDKTFSAAEYCSRITGVLAGLPLTTSATYYTLDEVVDITHISEAEANTKIDNGELILYYDDNVRIAKGINSLKTIIPPKNESYKKLKIVDIMDQITNDIKSTVKNSYIGKIPNSYDNKSIIIINTLNYLKELEKKDVLQKDFSTVSVDVEANKKYLIAHGIDTEELTDDDIKVADTGDSLYLQISLKIIDSIENVYININT